MGRGAGGRGGTSPLHPRCPHFLPAGQSRSSRDRQDDPLLCHLPGDEAGEGDERYPCDREDTLRHQRDPGTARCDLLEPEDEEEEPEDEDKPKDLVLPHPEHELGRADEPGRGDNPDRDDDREVEEEQGFGGDRDAGESGDGRDGHCGRDEGHQVCRHSDPGSLPLPEAAEGDRGAEERLDGAVPLLAEEGVGAEDVAHEYPDREGDRGDTAGKGCGVSAGAGGDPEGGHDREPYGKDYRGDEDAPVPEGEPYFAVGDDAKRAHAPPPAGPTCSR